VGRFATITRHHYACFTCGSASYSARMRQAAATSRFSQAGLRLRGTESMGWIQRRVAKNRGEWSTFFSKQRNSALTRFGGHVCLTWAEVALRSEGFPSRIERQRVPREEPEGREVTMAILRNSDGEAGPPSSEAGSAKWARLPQENEHGLQSALAPNAESRFP
jgi:hypothetical protein